MPAAVIARRVLQRNARLRGHARRVRAALLRLRFRGLARGGVDDRLVVFESFVGRSYAGSPRALYEAMLVDARFDGHRFAWSLRDPGAPTQLQASPRTGVVRRGSAEYYRAFGRARVWISNSILAPELVPRGQLYVQTWHGTGIKRIGLDVVAGTAAAMNATTEIDERYRIEAPKIGMFVTPAPFGTTVFASAFGLPAAGDGNPFVEVGNPRNDALVRAGADEVAAARARLGIPAGMRAVLYAPTFRDDQYDARTGYTLRPALDLDALATALGPGHVILVRGHYLVSATLGSDAVRDVSDIEDVNEVLLAADVLVTDYSSLCFDYTLLDRPIVFFLHDLEHYETDLRGFYFPVEDLPGTIVRTPDELTAALLDPDLAARDAARRRDARKTMCPHDDGYASERVLDLLLDRLGATA